MAGTSPAPSLQRERTVKPDQMPVSSPVDRDRAREIRFHCARRLTIDVKQVGRELGVRYVLEGSVRRSASRVRITGQLIDTATGAHLWADRFDGGLEDIFDLQDDVTASVVSAMAPKLEQAEIARAKRKPTESLDSYDYFLRGMASVYQWTCDDIGEALKLFYRAIALDPNFATAYGMAAWCYLWPGAGDCGDRAAGEARD